MFDMLPVNISILHITPQILSMMRPVSVLDMFEGGQQGGNFHANGLFSAEIFGRVGSDERDTRFSYIDLKTEIFHPIVYKQLITLKGLYAAIMAGKTFASWDDNLKDFVASDMLTGDTGYAFFMSKWRDIVFKETGSDIRTLRIQLIEKYKPIATTTKVLVLPAGLRDVSVDETGRTKEGEINPFYRKLIATANTISSNYDTSDSLLDTSRWSMQQQFNQISEYIFTLLSGKGGFFQKKWGSRKVFNSTRNVISSMDTGRAILGAKNSPSVNSTGIGLYQLSKAVLPLTIHLLLSGWISKVFNTDSGSAYLVNPSNLRRQQVNLSVETMDKWTTSSGIEKVITSFKFEHLRLKPVIVEGYYLGLVYRGPEGGFKIFGDIEELPAEFDKRYVYPMTLTELIYLCGYRKWNTVPLYITRYPVTGTGSIYPSYAYVKTTVDSQMRYELVENGDTWTLDQSDDYLAVEYPVIPDDPKLRKKIPFVDTLMPHPSRLALMGADFDGDTTSATAVMTDEAIQEIEAYLNSAKAYVNPQGGFINSSVVETIDRVLHTLTGDYVDAV